MLQSILAATDGSRYAQNAVELAGFLAAKCDAKLTVLHVYPHEVSEELRRLAQAEHLVPPAAGAPGAAAVPAALATVTGGPAAQPEMSRAAIEAIGRQILSAAEAEAKTQGAMKVNAIADDGDPARVILDYAKREQADLIVMGRRGLGDLQGLLMGSVSHKVSHLADCACLTVK